MHSAANQTGTATASHQCSGVYRATLAATIARPEVPTLASSHAPCARSRNPDHAHADTLRVLSTINTSHDTSATTPSACTNTG